MNGSALWLAILAGAQALVAGTTLYDLAGARWAGIAMLAVSVLTAGTAVYHSNVGKTTTQGDNVGKGP
jgi:hypothetical protein